MNVLKKINFKQPKYIIPMLVLLPLLFIAYQVSGVISFEKEEVETGVITEDINTDLPEINEEKARIKNRYEAMLDGFGKVTDYTAVDGIEQEEERKQVADLGYTDEEKARLDSIEAAREIEDKQLVAQLEEQQRRVMQINQDFQSKSKTEENIITRRQAQEEQRTRDRQELDKFAQQMKMIQDMSSGKPILTEEEKEAQRIKEIEAKERRRIQDSIAKANAPLEVTKAGAADEEYFHTVTTADEDPHLIKARVDQFVKVKDGSRLRLRLSEDVEIEGEILKKGSYLYATVSGFSAQRVKAKVNSVLLGGQIRKISLSVYDLDCMEGFYVPSSSFRDLAKEVGAGAMQMSVNMNSGDGEQSMESIAMQSLQQAFSSVTNAISGSIRQNKAKIKFNTEVYLVDTNAR